ncbi:glycosyltransferase [archaeon]|nr:MAG: glycosyltransferase [archaeon]
MKSHVVVLVLGDIGRSPRMQYHALSFTELKSIGKVTLVGYKGESLIVPLRTSTKLQVKYIEQPAFVQSFKGNKLLFTIMKGVGLLIALLQLFFSLSPFQLIVIQNPPVLPALIASLLVSLFRPFSILIDWHNLGFSMYAFSLGKDHVLTKVTRFLESTLCPLASHHITVSRAMAEYLKENFNISAVVCHDKPASIFSTHGISDTHRHYLLKKYDLLEENYIGHMTTHPGVFVETIQTIETVDGEIECKLGRGRVALVMSSTSWTDDEDFSLLYDAVLIIEHVLSNLCDQDKLKHYRQFNRMLVVITGKGELKETFEQKITLAQQQQLLGKHVFVQTAWLDTEDYPRLLQCADLGVSLHASTSGRDLPMKVVDMFGAGLPVCALNFPALSELVQQEENGLIFASAKELADQLLKVIFDIKVQGEVVKYYINDESTMLKYMRHKIKDMERWEEHWVKTVKPIVDAIVAPLDGDHLDVD